MGRAAREMNAATAEFDEHHHIEGFQEDRFHREEIAGENLSRVVGHELTPTG